MLGQPDTHRHAEQLNPRESDGLEIGFAAASPKKRSSARCPRPLGEHPAVERRHGTNPGLAATRGRRPAVAGRVCTGGVGERVRALAPSGAGWFTEPGVRRDYAEGERILLQVDAILA